MTLPQSSPERGRNRHVHFRYVNTPNGTTWHGWLAGLPHWFLCHTRGKTKPCLHDMTSGQLECPRCGETQEPEVIAYLPIYREVDGCPCMVILHECQREKVDQLPLHARVIIGREKDRADGVWVSLALRPTPTFQSTLDERRRAADLTETLLRLWALPDLTAWYRRSELEKEKEPPATLPINPEAPGSKSRVDRVNRDFARACMEARDKGNPPLADPLPVADVLPAVLRNGQHSKERK